MLLADLVEATPTIRSTSKIKGVEESISGIITEANSVLTYLSNSRVSNMSSVMEDIQNNANKEIQKIVDAIPEGYLGWPIGRSLTTATSRRGGQLVGVSSVSHLKQCPRGSVQQILRIADVLGLVVMPYSYVCPDRIAKDRVANTCNATTLAKNFNSELERNKMNTWIVAPVQYYSIEKNCKDMSYEIAVPSTAIQAFMALKLVMPLLINTMNQVNNLNQRMNNHGIDLDNLRNVVRQQQSQIDSIATQLKVERERRVAAELEQKRRMDEELARRAELVRFEMFDPLLIGVPSSVKNINDYQGQAILGPCWGPDIEPMIAELLGLSVNSKNKEHQKAMVTQFWHNM